MHIHELTPAECVDVLTRSTLARLACCHMNQPHGPVSFTYDPRQACLFSFSAIGKKVEWMRENPSVCLEVEDIDDRFHWTTVLVFGKCDEIGDCPGEPGRASARCICSTTARAGGCPVPQSRAPTTTRAW